MKSDILDRLIDILPGLRERHSPGTSLYEFLKTVAGRETGRLFSAEDPAVVRLGPFGDIVLPYYDMGAVDSVNLFDLDELILFGFYRANYGRYRRALDIGANIGLHTLILGRIGYEVTCYEPDPAHFSRLMENLGLNGIEGVKPVNAAVSARKGRAEFVRVLGNTTASHIKGAKKDPYGELESLPVMTEAFRDIMTDFDLVKLDMEGHEKDVLVSTGREDWERTDAVVEIENADNAGAVFEHFSKLGVNMFPQKINWNKAAYIGDMPSSYRDGMLFLSVKASMPWGGDG